MEAGKCDSRRWLRSVIPISVIFGSLILVLAALLALSRATRAAERNPSIAAQNALRKPEMMAVSTTCVQANGGVVLYNGPALEVTQVLTRVFVGNISSEPVAIGSSFDSCNPDGIFPTPCDDSVFDDWVSPQECISLPIKNHFSMQSWAWGNSYTLVDAYDISVVPPSPDFPYHPSDHLSLGLYYVGPVGQ